MSEYIYKRRRKLPRLRKFGKRYKTTIFDQNYTRPKERMTSHYPTMRKVTLSDNGGILHITQETVVDGKQIGCITANGMIYNVVIVPNPNPNTSIDDDIIVKKGKRKSEA